ncbi:MAG: TrkA family potassium uptake protein [Steroidobacteraceae bacterium]
MSAEAVLGIRAAIVAALFVLVLAIFLLDRDGLRDSIDGAVSVTDVVYFTMVTITTVGYGDIVPVSVSARMIDAFLVTPIRIFVWFIFIGTAYQLVVQRVIEDWRMSRLQQRLADHVVVCGFGNNGKSAAAEMMGKGVRPDNIIVIDHDERAVREAIDRGFVALHGEATREELLRVAVLDRAQGLIVTVGRDDTALMVVLTARSLGTAARIVVSAHENENIKLLRNAGADVIVMPWTFSGYLLADAITQRHIVDLLHDVLSPGGELSLTERMPHPAEIGRLVRELRYTLVMGIVRNDKRIMFWQDPDLRIDAHDQLIAMDARESSVPGAS